MKNPQKENSSEIQDSLDKEIRSEALRWLENNKNKEILGGEYFSPRISSEIPDCSMPMTFDSYNFCGLGCNYCVISGTEISTPKGKIPIEELKITDEVFSYSELLKKVEKDTVYSTMERTVNEILDIELENGSLIAITSNHPVFVNKKGWVCAGELKENDDILFMKRPGTSFHMSENNPMKNEETVNKMSASLKEKYESGELDELREKLKISGSRNRIKYNKSEEGRKKVSERMTKNNPMKNPEVAKKNGETRKELYASGERIPPALGNKRPDLSKRMTENNPMKDPEIRLRTLQKAVKTWVKQGYISEGEIKVKEALSGMEENFIHQAVIEGDGKRAFIMDFFIPEKKICIEYDGHSRHYTKKGIEKDLRRDNWLSEQYDIRTIRLHRNEAFIGKPKLISLLENRIHQ